MAVTGQSVAVLLAPSPPFATARKFGRLLVASWQDALQYRLEGAMWFLYDGAKHQFSANGVEGARDWVLGVNTVSKNDAMTGWRIGYVAGPSR
ncbi:MAG: aminotransferase class I/II-fold pyridoxal phosphate-dependent enzyme, partial [Chloroflexota bacterium]